MASTGEREAHIVFERDSGALQLCHLFHDGFGGTEVYVVTTGGTPRRPDLTNVRDGLMLTYVRDSILPGVQQMDFQEYDAVQKWGSASLLSFGLGVSSPTVAWDGGERLLFGWIIDNEAINGIPPLVHTRYRESGTWAKCERVRVSRSITACPWAAPAAGDFP